MIIDCFFFIIVVVWIGEKVIKDKFGDIVVFFLMYFNWDFFVVVFDWNFICFVIDGYFEKGYGGIVLVVVCGVDKDFVKDFVEIRNKGYNMIFY